MLQHIRRNDRVEALASERQAGAHRPAVDQARRRSVAGRRAAQSGARWHPAPPRPPTRKRHRPRSSRQSRSRSRAAWARPPRTAGAEPAARRSSTRRPRNHQCTISCSCMTAYSGIAHEDPRYIRRSSAQCQGHARDGSQVASLASAHDRYPKAPAFSLRLRLRPLGDGHPDRPGESPAQHRRRSPRHLRLGEWMIANGRLLTIDNFSFTRGGQPFVAFEWGSEVLFAGAHRLGGLAGRGGAGRTGAGAHLRAGRALPAVARRSSRCWRISPHGGGAARRLALGGAATSLHHAAGGHAAHSARGGGPAPALVVRCRSSGSGPISTAGSPTGSC